MVIYLNKCNLCGYSLQKFHTAYPKYSILRVYPKLFQRGLHELRSGQRSVVERQWGGDRDQRVLDELSSGFDERVQLLQ